MIFLQRRQLTLASKKKIKISTDKSLIRKIDTDTIPPGYMTWHLKKKKKKDRTIHIIAITKTHKNEENTPVDKILGLHQSEKTLI